LANLDVINEGSFQVWQDERGEDIPDKRMHRVHMRSALVIEASCLMYMQ
jgi:hypothetical protein